MKSDTKQRIINFIRENDRVTPKAIIEHLNLNASGIFRHLTQLVEKGLIVKSGVSPRVFYSLAEKSSEHYLEDHFNISQQDIDIIEKNFFKVSPSGEIKQGVKAFIDWCLERKNLPAKTANEYVQTIDKYSKFKKGDVIDGYQKIKTTFDVVYLDEVYFFDFYSLERFGKTRLGELILYAKQSQNLDLIKTVVSDVKDKIFHLIKEKEIDAVGFIPPTVPRKIQFIKEFQRLCPVPVRSIQITKIKSPIIVPQKTLASLREREQNVNQTMIVEETLPFKNILLIDDAVGSGATLNLVAKQIRQKNICSGKIIGLGLVGSFNGFDVIREV